MENEYHLTTNLRTPRHALAIGAHPDDIELGCGGTLAKWTARGCAISLLVLTDGSKGSWDPNVNPKELIARRKLEQSAAARLLGSKNEVIFLASPDGELEAGRTERAEVARWIRQIAPDVILGHDPWKRYRLHPDHRSAGFLTTDGIVMARDPLFLPEFELPPHRPDVLLLWEADEVDHVEDVSASFDTKIAALLEHHSQLRSTMGIVAGSRDAAIQTAHFRDQLAKTLGEIGQPHGFALAEGFKRMDDL